MLLSDPDTDRAAVPAAGRLLNKWLGIQDKASKRHAGGPGQICSGVIERSNR